MKSVSGDDGSYTLTCSFEIGTDPDINAVNVNTAVRMAAVSHALAGRPDEAKKFMDRTIEMDPALRVSNLKGLLPLRRPEDFAKWADALRLAGLPD
jgi:hypothetical protein